MPAQEMSEELRNDLRILRMRSALDPKRFYKHSDMNTLPKFVQVRQLYLLTWFQFHFLVTVKELVLEFLEVILFKLA